jgi:hypothetical protein
MKSKNTETSEEQGHNELTTSLHECLQPMPLPTGRIPKPNPINPKTEPTP